MPNGHTPPLTDDEKKAKEAKEAEDKRAWEIMNARVVREIKLRKLNYDRWTNEKGEKLDFEAASNAAGGAVTGISTSSDLILRKMDDGRWTMQGEPFSVILKGNSATLSYAPRNDTEFRFMYGRLMDTLQVGRGATSITLKMKGEDWSVKRVNMFLDLAANRGLAVTIDPKFMDKLRDSPKAEDRKNFELLKAREEQLAINKDVKGALKPKLFEKQAEEIVKSGADLFTAKDPTGKACFDKKGLEDTLKGMSNEDKLKELDKHVVKLDKRAGELEKMQAGIEKNIEDIQKAMEKLLERKEKKSVFDVKNRQELTHGEANVADRLADLKEALEKNLKEMEALHNVLSEERDKLDGMYGALFEEYEAIEAQVRQENTDIINCLPNKTLPTQAEIDNAKTALVDAKAEETKVKKDLDAAQKKLKDAEVDHAANPSATTVKAVADAKDEVKSAKTQLKTESAKVAVAQTKLDGLERPGKALQENGKRVEEIKKKREEIEKRMEKVFNKITPVNTPDAQAAKLKADLDAQYKAHQQFSAQQRAVK